MMLAIDRNLIANFTNSVSNILHFAPEVELEKIFRARYENYLTADLFFEADIKINIENIDLEDVSFDIIIANHVLEHVDDGKAAKELARILKERGVLVCQMPIVEGWKETYENVSATSERDRLIHHGQSDHLRLCGADFRKRIC